MRVMHRQKADVSDARLRPSMEDVRESEKLTGVFTPQPDAELAPRTKARRKSFQHLAAVRWLGLVARGAARVFWSRLQQCLKRLNIAVLLGAQLSPHSHTTRSHAVKNP